MKFVQHDDGVVKVISSNLNNILPKIEIGKVYHSFDDGKVRMTRLVDWRITKCINVDNLFQWLSIPRYDRKMMRREIKNCYWLYDNEQHFIYKAQALYPDGTDDKETGITYFIKTHQNTWFGICSDWYDCLLDADGSLYEWLQKGEI